MENSVDTDQMPPSGGLLTWIYIVCSVYVCQNTKGKYGNIWAARCESVSSGICGQRRPRSACASAHSDQGLRCPQTESLDTKGVNGKQMHLAYLSACDVNPYNLRMFEDTFSLDAAHL